MKPLAITGSAALLEELSPLVPDEFINALFQVRRGRGRRRDYSEAQLFRVMLLVLLTPAHSFNLLVQLLPEQKSWRAFARLRNKWDVPDAKMLHNFRDRLGVGKLRAINAYLLAPLLEKLSSYPKTLAIIDATDFPAATSAFKKSSPRTTPLTVPAWAVGRSRLGKVGGLSVTKNTPYACGCASQHKRFS